MATKSKETATDSIVSSHWFFFSFAAVLIVIIWATPSGLRWLPFNISLVLFFPVLMTWMAKHVHTQNDNGGSNEIPSSLKRVPGEIPNYYGPGKNVEVRGDGSIREL